jgi:hypothetical protein
MQQNVEPMTFFLTDADGIVIEKKIILDLRNASSLTCKRTKLSG